MSIESNLRDVQTQIASACATAARDPATVRLVAVSKTKTIEIVRAAFRAGQTIFGENYVQEAVDKASSLPEAEWHLIGSLQTNKVKSVVGRFALIHSVDRLKLVKELARAAAGLGVTQDILLQVHVGDEDTKQGVSFHEAPALIREILALPTLRLRGLMALPPLVDDEVTARGAFASVLEALIQWRRELMTPAQAAHFTELSMGTSSDFEWAVLEGATLVRVGTAIFGAREL